MKKRVIIRTQFSAIHHWPDCPIEEVVYLRSPHRHTFYLELKFDISHNDRDIEFISLKNKIAKDISKHWEGANIGRRSCEDIAEEFMNHYDAVYVSVFEDNENGAELEKV